MSFLKLAFDGAFRWAVFNQKSLAFSFVGLVLLSNCKTSDFTGDGKKAEALPPVETRSFVQVTRETRTVTANQGSKGATSNESYNVSARGVLDLLVVVDNSGSMAEEQNNLSQKLKPLMSAVKDSDWQIAVTTTDPDDRCVTSLIKKNDLFAETRFKSAVNAG
ncbi:MAG: hypothetical protein NTV34_08550, partial [Proteobacteria bacterium]|nr:hypothetical protein [Pseudomonadota bacterium]